jgi:hypothetical protein
VDSCFTTRRFVIGFSSSSTSSSSSSSSATSTRKRFREDDGKNELK